MAGGVRERAGDGDAALVEPGADGGKLRPGDGGIGVEAAIAAAVDDPQRRHGGDGRAGPVVLTDVGERIAGGQIVVPDVLVEKPEEDRRHLGSRDAGVGPDGVVGVALEVGVVGVAVEQIGDGGLRPAGEQGDGAADPEGLVLVHPHGQLPVPVPAGKAVPGPGGDVGAVLVIVVDVEREVPPLPVDGVELRAAVGVEFQVRVAVVVVISAAGGGVGGGVSGLLLRCHGQLVCLRCFSLIGHGDGLTVVICNS